MPWLVWCRTIRTWPTSSLALPTRVWRREFGELYRLSLERRVVELGIQKNVLFHKRYVTNDDLAEYLQAADLYVTPYPGKEQITSGTLANALASGRAIISTPYLACAGVAG